METRNGMGAVRRYAEGGFISKLFGGKSETISEKYARQDAEFKAKHPPAPVAPAQTPPTPAPNPLGGIKGMVEGSLTKSLQDREKAAGLKNGGPVQNIKPGGAIRGPGTATSDSVPLMGSDGEFMIKASAVKKIGLPALEALNAMGDNPKGAIKKLHKAGHMATGGLVEEEEKRMANAAPSGNIATPTAPYTPAVDSQQANFGIQSAADGYLPGESVMDRAGRRISSLVPVAAGVLQKVANPDQPWISPSAPAAPVPQPVSAVPQPTPTPQQIEAIAARSAGVPNPSAIPATNPAAPAPAEGAYTVNGVTGKDVGYGATRYDIKGKSPLFTNLTGPDAQRSNEALVNRGPVSAMNQGAMDGIQARQDMRDQQLANQSQYDKEVAAATATNNWQARKNLEDAALGTSAFMGRPGTRPSKAAQKLLADTIANETTQRGQDMLDKRSAIADKQNAATGALERDKFGLTKTETIAKLAQEKLKTDLFAKYTAAKDPAEKAALAEQINLLNGTKAQNPVRAFAVPGGQATDANGQVYTMPSTVYDPDTRSFVQQGAQGQGAQPKQIAEGSISTVGGKTAKYIGGKWVPQ